MKQRNLYKLIMTTVLIVLLHLSCAHRPPEAGEIAVGGSGSMKASPDMGVIYLSLSHLAPTSVEAREGVSEMAVETLNLLAERGIEAINIETQSLSFNPEYDYSGPERKLLGQRARQSLTVKIHHINREPELLTDVIDALARVEGLEMHNLNFDLSDKSALTSEARERAFDDGSAKAEALADLSGRKLGRVIRVEEGASNPGYPINARMMLADGMAESIPAGEIEVSVQLTIVFALE